MLTALNDLAESCAALHYSLNQNFKRTLWCSDSNISWMLTMTMRFGDVWIKERFLSRAFGEKKNLWMRKQKISLLRKKNILLGSEDQQQKYIIHFVICFSSMQCACFWNKQQIHWDFAFFVVFFLLFISGYFFLFSESNIFSCPDSRIAQ